jgi:cytidylate kinase
MNETTNIYGITRNDVSQQNTHNNKITSHKSKFIHFSMQKRKNTIGKSPLFYNNKVFMVDALRHDEVVSPVSAISTRKNPRDKFGYRPRSRSV